MIFFVLLTFYAYLQIWRIFRDKKNEKMVSHHKNNIQKRSDIKNVIFTLIWIYDFDTLNSFK